MIFSGSRTIFVILPATEITFFSNLVSENRIELRLNNVSKKKGYVSINATRMDEMYLLNGPACSLFTCQDCFSYCGHNEPVWQAGGDDKKYFPAHQAAHQIKELHCLQTPPTAACRHKVIGWHSSLVMSLCVYN
jgi:hypothetical protein